MVISPTLLSRAAPNRLCSSLEKIFFRRTNRGNVAIILPFMGSCQVLVMLIAGTPNPLKTPTETSVLRGGLPSKQPDSWLISPDHQKRARAHS
jgi:hypothetical protein